MAQDNAPRKIDTALSDRDLLLHILAHVEALTDVVAAFAPLLEIAKGPNGKPDMIGISQLRRSMRRART